MNIVLSCGDTNGIGPEICIKALNTILRSKVCSKFFLIIPGNAWKKLASYTPPDFIFECITDYNQASIDPYLVSIILIPDAEIIPGQPTKNSGEASLCALNVARNMLFSSTADALVTAPISKEAIHLAGSEYGGHTEMIADWAGLTEFQMMFYSSEMTGALLTIHVPLRDVSALITENRIDSGLKVISRFLINDLGISNPKIAFLGLNPHAGENGLIGIEEKKFQNCLKFQGCTVEGFFPADAFFGQKLFRNYHCIVAFYHDQLLIPFKLLSMDSGVNVTAGLPFIRTSPDHGTAYNISWQNKANEQSMVEAIKLAEKIGKNRGL
ncbi:MAG: 4-hydroxythreonine-4-phosphate dehydrogenase PdxA [Ignavibacteria bacterium]|nr:4-hydroxythreonine-4-phosphate dehydrogenase PdxA [Ignavibacteria bacterium]